MRVSTLCVVAALVAFAAAQTAAPDPCAQYPTCQICVAQPLCGWCSEPVTYPGPHGTNITGAQCAGFNPNGADPFTCSAIFSTEVCVAGYQCNLETFTCQQGAPGTGVPLDVCSANCTNTGQVFACNTTTQKCNQVPQGTPGAASLEVCEQQCTHPSSHPSSANPASPPPPAQTYLCNVTTGTCNPTTPGKGSSQQVCEQNCVKGQNMYLCNSLLHKCIQLPPGVPGGQPLEQCNNQCNPKPNPGPPAMFLGVWRGLEIQNNFVAGEWDINVTQSEVTMVNVAAATTIKGVPQQVSQGGQEIFIIQITSGPGAGKSIQAIGEQANRGPETSFVTMAMAQPGANAPSSIASAMTTPGDIVLALAQCVPNVNCLFTMPSTRSVRRRSASEQAVRVSFNDPCSAYSANCSVCIHAPDFCGWCSQKVQYVTGETGTQCAGFSRGSNPSTAFVCQGRYSTTNCDTGYNCDKSSGTCVPNPTPGDGVPLNECQQICHPPPSPTPVPDQYVCNITTKQCHKCTDSFCPGAMPKDTCAAACVKPKPGPSSLVVGKWRGLEIQNSYPLGEVDWTFNSSSFTVEVNGAAIMSGDVESFGGDVMILAIKTGAGAGHRISCIYTIQDQGSMYSWMTLAMSEPDGPIPTSYQVPMMTPPMQEQILVKCQQSPCKF